MPARLLSLALAVALASGCADDPDRAPADVPPPDPVTAGRPSSPTADLDTPPEVRPGVQLDRLLADRSDAAAFLADLRPPRSRRAEPTPNQYVEGQTDTVRTTV